MLEELVRKYALQNAIAHDGKADSGAVIGKIIAARPELKNGIKDIIPLIKRICGEVGGLPLEEQRALLESIAPELLQKKEGKKATLADLPGVGGEVVMRFAPGPSGPLHLGHTRAIFLNEEYVKRYGGRYIIRIEDTNPLKIDPEAYDSIIEDLKWLQVSYHEVVIQSGRFGIYYDMARKLLEMGKAYICQCDVEDWRGAKLKMKPCPHRELDVATQLESWEGMLSGTFSEHEASYVVKTDLSHPNPAVRDFVGFRIVSTPHPRTGTRFRVYPLYNFSVAVDDHLMGMTHVLRGKDHLNNTYRQEFIFAHLQWKKPEYIHYGLVQIVDTALKKTLISQSIKKGEFTGWDDVRLATLKTLAKRGISPAALRRYWVEVGIKEVDIKFSWDNLYSYNKDIVDDRANRYFFVPDPKRLTITGVDSISGHAPLHPDHPERGVRDVRLLGDSKIIVFIPKDDLSRTHKDEKLRLKDLCNIRLIKDEEAEFIGNDMSILKEGVRIIQWVAPDAHPLRLLMPDGAIREGLSEKIGKDDLGGVVQFERVGFARVIEKEGGYEAYFAHR